MRPHGKKKLDNEKSGKKLLLCLMAFVALVCIVVVLWPRRSEKTAASRRPATGQAAGNLAQADPAPGNDPWAGQAQGQPRAFQNMANGPQRPQPQQPPGGGIGGAGPDEPGPPKAHEGKKAGKEKQRIKPKGKKRQARGRNQGGGGGGGQGLTAGRSGGRGGVVVIGGGSNNTMREDDDDGEDDDGEDDDGEDDDDEGEDDDDDAGEDDDDDRDDDVRRIGTDLIFRK